MIEVLLKISILVWPFGQLLSYRVGQANFPIYLLDLLSIFLSIFLLIGYKSRKQISKDPISAYLLGFIVVCGLSLLVNIRAFSLFNILKASLYLLRVVTYPSFYYAVKLVKWENIKSSVTASLILFLSLSLFQYVIFPDTRALKYAGFDDHYFRLIGTFFDPNYTGAMLAAIGLYFLTTNKYIVAITVLPLLALTYSRASYLTYLLGAIWITLKKRIKYLLLLLFLIPLSVFLSPRPYGEGVNLLRTFSIFSRFNSWIVGINLFIERPLLGWGYNTLTNLNGQRIGIDNSYLFILATTGIVGFVIFLWLLYKSLKPVWKTTLFLPLMALLFHSLFNNSFFFIWINSAFWLMLGLAYKTKE